MFHSENLFDIDQSTRHNGGRFVGWVKSSEPTVFLPACRRLFSLQAAGDDGEREAHQQIQRGSGQGGLHPELEPGEPDHDTTFNPGRRRGLGLRAWPM